MLSGALSQSEKNPLQVCQFVIIAPLIKLSATHRIVGRILICGRRSSGSASYVGRARFEIMVSTSANGFRVWMDADFQCAAHMEDL